jgi:hypothetical protein
MTGRHKPPHLRSFKAMTMRSMMTALMLVCVFAALPARASWFSLEASGTISSNSSGDSTIPVGTPWTLELIYDSAAPDLDFELTGSPDPTSGRFNNTASPPALHFFHYQAASYEVTFDDSTDFGPFSEILITSSAINAIDINIRDSALFPPLAGGPVTFHADFNRFASPPIFTSDALPTDTSINAASFNQNTVSLLLARGEVSGGSLTSLTITAVPEPAAASLALAVLLAGGAFTLLRRFTRRCTKPFTANEQSL